MFFSKSFGYAVRSVLYIALMQDEKRYVQTEEIALNLDVPRHFVGKILKKLVKAAVLQSVKGPCGGFALNGQALDTTLLQLFFVTDGQLTLHRCVLCVKECSAQNPCPLHAQMNEIKSGLLAMLAETALCDLLKEDKATFMRSITAEEAF